MCKLNIRQRKTAATKSRMTFSPAMEERRVIRSTGDRSIAGPHDTGIRNPGTVSETAVRLVLRLNRAFEKEG